MALTFTPGLVNKMLGFTGGSTFRSLMQGGFLDIYSGTKPTSATNVEAGTRLVQIRKTGVAAGSLGWCIAASILGGSIKKAGASLWQGVTSTTVAGVASWYRFYSAASVKGNTSSATLCRFDGSVGTTSSFDLQLTSTTISVNQPITIDSFKIKIPMSA